MGEDMKYIVQALSEGSVLHEVEVEAENRNGAVAKLMALAPDVFEEDENPCFDERAVEEHTLSLRVMRSSPNDEERSILESLNSDPRSPFRDMIAMPKEG
jgi:hypothetical protein